MSVLHRKSARNHKFSCRLPSPDQVTMIRPKACRVRGKHRPIYNHSKRNPPLMNGLDECDAFHGLVSQAMPEACNNKKNTQDRGTAHKSEEIPVISPPNTIVKPNAMMILSFNTIIANSTVITARRSPNVASFAIFYRDFHCRSNPAIWCYRDPSNSWWAQRERVFAHIGRKYRARVPWQDLDYA